MPKTSSIMASKEKSITEGYETAANTSGVFADTKLLNKVLDTIFSVLSEGEKGDHPDDEKGEPRKLDEINPTAMAGVSNNNKVYPVSNQRARQEHNRLEAAMVVVIIVLVTLGAVVGGVGFFLTEKDVGEDSTSLDAKPAPTPTLAPRMLALFGRLYNISNTTDIDLFNEGFTGTIPTELGLLTNLRNLDLGWNILTGTIPTEVGMLTGLKYFDLGWNALTGDIPTEVGRMESLNYLRLSSNFLNTALPTELGLLTGLELLIDDDSNHSANISRPAANYIGVNWVPRWSKYYDGWIVPSGIDNSSTVEDVTSQAKYIVSQLSTKIDKRINTIRLAINPPTVLDGDWWPKYQKIIEESVTQEMQVILGCWGLSESGKIDESDNYNITSSDDSNHENHTRFNAMWDTVIELYGDNDMVSFQIFHSPHGYSDEKWREIAATWVARYGMGDPEDLGSSDTDVPKIADRSRIFVSGSGYNEYVIQVAQDKRFDGCMLSFTLFPWQGNHHDLDGWKDELAGRVGRENAYRTVVVEWGVPMWGDPKPRYDELQNWSSIDDDHKRIYKYMVAMSEQIRTWHMGSVNWPGLRDGDHYSLVDRHYANNTIYNVNPSGVKLFGDSFAETS